MPIFEFRIGALSGSTSLSLGAATEAEEELSAMD
jgi:hypothetical protein